MILVNADPPAGAHLLVRQKRLHTGYIHGSQILVVVASVTAWNSLVLFHCRKGKYIAMMLPVHEQDVVGNTCRHEQQNQ